MGQKVYWKWTKTICWLN